VEDELVLLDFAEEELGNKIVTRILLWERDLHLAFVKILENEVVLKGPLDEVFSVGVLVLGFALNVLIGL
jgi:hypothetical protein